MPKFDVDYNNLKNSVERNVYRLADVQHKLEKVAFDAKNI